MIKLAEIQTVIANQSAILAGIAALLALHGEKDLAMKFQDISVDTYKKLSLEVSKVENPEEQP